jgi:hypothetical protein
MGHFSPDLCTIAARYRASEARILGQLFLAEFNAVCAPDDADKLMRLRELGESLVGESDTEAPRTVPERRLAPFQNVANDL